MIQFSSTHSLVGEAGLELRSKIQGSQGVVRG